MKKIIVALVLLFGVNAWAQTRPDPDEKSAYSITENGEHPDTWDDGFGHNYSYIRNTGLQNATNQHMCFAQGDANCNMQVAFAPGGAPIEIRVRDGDGATLADVSQPNTDDYSVSLYSLNVIDHLYGYDRAGANWDRIDSLFAPATFNTANNGLVTMAGNYFWETGGSAFTRWPGAAMADDVTNPTTAWVGNFNMLYDETNTNWNRMRGDTSGNLTVNQSTSYPGYSRIQDGDGTGLADVVAYNVSPANTTLGLQTIAAVYGIVYHDVANLTYAEVLTTQADAIDNTTNSLFTTNFNMGFDTGLSSWSRIDAVSTQADDLSVSRNGLFTSSVLYAYDGAGLDMLRIGAVGELQVTDVATRPGEDQANDWRKVKKTAIQTYSPAKETSGVIDDAPPVVVLASKEVLGYPNYCVFMYNFDDAAKPLTDVKHYVSADNSHWVALTDPATCDTLAALVTCVFCVSGNAYRYVKVEATAGAGADAVDGVDVWITANVD